MIRKMLSKILQNQEEIKKGLSKETAEKAGRFDEINEWLPEIKMSASFKSVKNLDGSTTIQIEYSIPPETIVIEENGVLHCSKRFKAINMCDLIPRDTQEKLSETINSAKKKKE